MKRTIAERTVVAKKEKEEKRQEKKERRKGRRLHVAKWGTVGVLAALAYFFKYVFPGYSFTALVCVCLIGVILFYTVMPWIGKIFPKFARTVTIVVSCLLLLGLMVVGTTEAIIIRSSAGAPGENVDYMVVLGAKVRPDGPSVSLQDRIDAAYEYLTAHPDVVAVVSGGQGNDEHMTEAQCMYEELTAMGIEPERVWMEDQASSTWENMHFSLNLIEERTGSRPEKLGVLSSEYHLFRASLFARRCNVEFVGIPAHTSRLSQRINHFMREVAGVWHYILLGGRYND